MSARKRRRPSARNATRRNASVKRTSKGRSRSSTRQKLDALGVARLMISEFLYPLLASVENGVREQIGPDTDAYAGRRLAIASARLQQMGKTVSEMHEMLKRPAPRGASQAQAHKSGRANFGRKRAKKETR